MAPGRFFASSTNSLTVFHGLSARTTRIVGSAEKSAIGTSWSSVYIGARPRILSASGITETLESAIMIV